MDKRLFIGVFPCGLSYCDKTKEEDGDYKKLAFLPYSTLKLKFYNCPPELRKEIEENASKYKEGENKCIIIK